MYSVGRVCNIHIVQCSAAKVCTVQLVLYCTVQFVLHYTVQFEIVLSMLHLVQLKFLRLPAYYRYTVYLHVK